MVGLGSTPTPATAPALATATDALPRSLVCADFCSGLGIAGLFGLAASFNTTTDEINNLTSNWSIFMLGPGGICAVFFIKRYGRLPVLFWSQVFGLGFTIGCAVAPNLSVFAAMRILQGTFQTAPQCVGLWTVADLFPFHLQARKINLWTLGFIVSPFISPWLLGYMFAHLGGATTEGYAPWRSVYWVGVGYCTLVVVSRPRPLAPLHRPNQADVTCCIQS